MLRLLQYNDKIHRERNGFYSFGKFFWAESIYQTVEHEHHKVQRREYIMRMFMKQSKKGFTLIEMIVVIVIVAILVALAVPSVMRYIKDARDNKFLSVARNVYTDTQMIAIDTVLEYGVFEKYLNDKSLQDSTEKQIVKKVLERYPYTSTENNVGNYKMFSSLLVIHFDNNNIGLKFDRALSTHNVTKMGIVFYDESSNKYATVVILSSGDSKVFHENPFISENMNDINSKWFIDWESSSGKQ